MNTVIKCILLESTSRCYTNIKLRCYNDHVFSWYVKNNLLGRFYNALINDKILINLRVHLGRVFYDEIKIGFDSVTSKKLKELGY